MNKEQYIEELKGLIARTAIPGYVHGMNIAVTLAEDLDVTPAIDWKPINKDEMVIGQNYLLWSTITHAPETGYLNKNDYFVSTWGDVFEDEPTHYAEFNKPEGVE